MNLIRKGKVKEVYDIGNGKLEFVFTDNISVFDKIIPTEIPYKGETLCRTTEFWFRRLNEIGIKNHFIERTDKNRMVVKRVDVIEDYSRIGTSTVNYLIPLEVICRHYVAGSMHDALKKGKTRPEDIGFPAGHMPRYGEKFPEPYFEFTTKLEKVDRKLDMEEAKRIAGLTDEDVENIKSTVLKIDGEIERAVELNGLIHVDGKKEFAFDENRELMVIDGFGTADEDRFWDKERYDNGDCVELSKEFVRQHYRKTGYHKKLMDAREREEEEPPIPGLDNETREEVSRLYIRLFERITGEKF